jgi:hypothetical protein
MHVGHESEDGRRHQGYLNRRPDLRDEPILTIALLNPQPIHAGDPLKVRCTLTNPTTRTYTGRKPTIQRLYFSHVRRSNSSPPPSPGVRREIELPATWNTLAPGASMSADLEFDGPRTPDSFEFFCTWFLYDPKPDSTTGVGSVYSNMLNLQVIAGPATVPQTR